MHDGTDPYLISGAMLEKYPKVSILQVCGTKIEDIGLGTFIPQLAKRKVSFKSDEDASKIPEDLKKHCLHSKIRDELSKEEEIREFIKYEEFLSSMSDGYKTKLSEDHKKLQEISDKYIGLKEKAESVVLSEAKVIFCTCAEAGSKRTSTIQVEQCIIDECAMCIEPETLLPMVLSKKIILVGDHKQLQPVVLSKTAESLGLKISMFQRLFEGKNMSDHCIMLTEQYRMVSSTFCVVSLLHSIFCLCDTAQKYL